MGSILFITGRQMVSVENEASKLIETFKAEGYSVDVVEFNRARSVHRDYDFAFWWTPLLSVFFRELFIWNRPPHFRKMVIYTVIEGVHNQIRLYVDEINRHIVVTPSMFVKRICKYMGINVKEVIPHQLPNSLPIDHEYGKAWRSKFPKDKKVLIYNGSQVMRKALPKLREAIDILSRKRNDFVMVFHTDNVNFRWHTPVKDLIGVNTVVETDFSRISLAKAYAKMFYSDVVVHPAVCEGFGLPIAEALALGKRLVCVNAPGVNEIANPRNSWMVMNVYPCPLEWPNWITFWAVDYEARDLAEQIDLCLDAKSDEVENKKVEGFKAVERLHDSYKAFLKFFRV
jgi:glycosyltransferase involved in cell wall biosynthesis